MTNHDLNEYEIKVLRDHASTLPTQMLFGAAYNAASEVLKKAGFLHGPPYRISNKGRNFIDLFDAGIAEVAPPPSDYEINVLRWYCGQNVNIAFNPTFNTSSIRLAKLGFLTPDDYRPTEKATAYLKAIDEQLPKAGKPAINSITRNDVETFQNKIDQRGEGIDNAINLYQRIATKSAIYPGKGTPFGLMYAALGLAEAGEVQNKIKKAFRDDGAIDFEHHGNQDGTIDEYHASVSFRALTPERRAQIIKELGGVLWYLSAVCNEIGATLSEVALINLEELCSRTERDTLRGDGDDR